MTKAQRQFWEGVRDYAQAVRRSKRVDLDVARDALALEEEITARLLEAPASAVAEPAQVGTEGT